MKSKLLSFFGGVALGVALAIGGFLARKPATAPPPTNPAASQPAAAAPDTEEALVTAQRRVASLEADNAKLASRVQDLLRKEAAPALAAPEATAEEDSNPFAALAKAFGNGGATNRMSEAMTGMMRTMLEVQVSSKVSNLKRRLDLTDEQERTLTSVLMRQADASVEAGKRMLGGKLSQEELSQLGEQTKTPHEEIQALLTPEQWQAFQEHEKQERRQQARAAANAELLQMQTQLGLELEQEDQVRAVLSEQALAQFNSGQQFSAVGGGANAIEFIRRQNEQKQEALRGVLTAEQFDRYQKYQVQQMKMIETFMPKSPAAPPPNVRRVPPSEP